MAKLASGTLLQQIGLSTHNLVRWYLPTAAGVYAFFWLEAPDGGDVFHGEKPRTLSESACMLRRACALAMCARLTACCVALHPQSGTTLA